jgi:diguanylate cyclase (GGDEF)-like protein
LQQELADVRREFNEDHAAQLMEANEHLLIAAIEAQIAAEAATLNRDLLERSSQRDPLTDTPNRASMLDLMENAFSQSQSQGHYAAIVFLDLDKLKTINDTLGHSTGDMVLQLVAQRLKSSVRDSDAVSRQGGDEFVVPLANITTPIDIVTIAQKMLRDIAAQTRVGGHLLNLSASLGIAVCPNDGNDAEILISLADAAMYRAKWLRTRSHCQQHLAHPPCIKCAQAQCITAPRAATRPFKFFLAGQLALPIKKNRFVAPMFARPQTGRRTTRNLHSEHGPTQSASDDMFIFLKRISMNRKQVKTTYPRL